MTPLVSCLMVSRADRTRIEYFKQSIECYCAQTHDRRELIIILDHPTSENEGLFLAAATSFSRGDIHCFAGRGPSLGALRNESAEYASGEITCVWDDDDLNHPERVERQLRFLEQSGKAASILQEHCHFFRREKKLYVVNWGNVPELRGHPGTLMAWKAAAPRYPETGPTSIKGEDTNVVVGLWKRGHIASCAAMPHLFVYTFHGGNIWDFAHHERLERFLSARRVRPSVHSKLREIPGLWNEVTRSETANRVE
jgi:glycosyltransferase involved in cell wall biosynthesis